MPLTVVDHTDPHWAARFTRLDRNNGAATYSREIVEHQLPVWRDHLDPRANVVISTCPVLVRDVKADLIVQYLHTYQYVNPLRQAAAVAANVTTPRLVFVTAYLALHHQLQAAGHHSIHVPMTVDVANVRAHAQPKIQKPRQIVYFGNVLGPKRRQYQLLRNACAKARWTMHLVNDRDQAAALRHVSTYHYGIGVGRCALEMQALGLKVMYAGQEFGGIATTAAENQVQSDANHNGRVTTYDRDPIVCLRSLHLAGQYPDHDVAQAVGVLDLEVDRVANDRQPTLTPTTEETTQWHEQ